MPQRHLIVIFAVVLASIACYRATEHDPNVRMLQRAMNVIMDSYVEKVDEERLVESAITGMMSKLDENSAFNLPDKTQDLRNDLEQQFGGIGIEVSPAPSAEGLLVVSPIPGSPAFEAGILPGDIIFEIDGESAKGTIYSDTIKKIRGVPGTNVELKIRRPSRQEPLTVTLARAVIKTESVKGDTRDARGGWNFNVESQPDLGYVRITTFGERTVDEVTATMAKLHGSADKGGGVKGVILDLRLNPGGLLKAAVGACDLFLKDGVIVSLRGRDGRGEQAFTASGHAPYANLPLVVIVDRGSASASEIVAACLQDHGRAIVVGERSFGKGTVQNVIDLEGDHSLRLTTAHYYRPSGRNIHRLKSSKPTDEWGVVPNPGFEVPQTEDQLSSWIMARNNRDHSLPPSATAEAPSADSTPFADPVLDKAVEALRKAITDRDGKKSPPSVPAA